MAGWTFFFSKIHAMLAAGIRQVKLEIPKGILIVIFSGCISHIATPVPMHWGVAEGRWLGYLFKPLQLLFLGFADILADDPRQTFLVLRYDSLHDILMSIDGLSTPNSAQSWLIQHHPAAWLALVHSFSIISSASSFCAYA